MMYVIAGEMSGDLIGAKLLSALKEMIPMPFKGVGGPEMERQGLISLAPFTDFHVMGFSDVICSLPTLYKHFHTLIKAIMQDQPKAVVMIDYPGFNLRLAKKLRTMGYTGKLIQYVSPTVWAWKKTRIEKMAQTLDCLLTILPFESAYFENTPLKTVFVGHPLASPLSQQRQNPDFRKKYGIPENTPLLALFPGSRPKEIERHLPLFLKAAEIFMKKYPAFGCAIALPHAPLANASRGKKYYPIDPKDRYDLMLDAHLALAKSGTVALELAYLQCPATIAYQLTSLNYFLAKYLFNIRLPFYSLPNILLKEEVFKEFYHKDLSPHLLADALVTLFQNQTAVKESLSNIPELLTDKDASQEAAKEIIGCIMSP